MSRFFLVSCILWLPAVPAVAQIPAAWQGGSGDWDSANWTVDGTANQDFQAIAGNNVTGYDVDLTSLLAGQTLSRDNAGTDGGQLVLTDSTLVQSAGLFTITETGDGTSSVNVQGAAGTGSTVTLSGTAAWELNLGSPANTQRGFRGIEGVLTMSDNASITTLPANAFEIEGGFTANVQGNSRIDTGFIEFGTGNSDTSFFNFEGGTIVARTSNPIRVPGGSAGSDFASNRLNFAGATGAAEFIATDFSNPDTDIAAKLTQQSGFFAIDGIVVRDEGMTYVNGRGFEIDNNPGPDGGQRLRTVAQPANSFVYSAGVDGEWTDAANWNNGLAASGPNSASHMVVFNGGFSPTATDGETPVVSVASSVSAGQVFLSHTNVSLNAVSGTTVSISGEISQNEADATARTITFGGDGNYTATTGTAGAINVVKAGAGSMSLAGPNHTGTTTVEGGTLTVTGIDPQGDVTVRAGATLDVSAVAFNLNAAQAIAGGGEIVGNLGLFDDNFVDIGDSVGTLNVDGNVTLTGFGTNLMAGNFTWELGDDPGVVGGTENDLIDISGGLTVMGPFDAVEGLAFNIVPVEGSLTNGSYRLIDYTGGAVSLTGIRAVFADANGAPITDTRQTLSLASVANQVNLVVGGTAAMDLTWDGGNVTNPTFWDVNTTANFDSSTEAFFNLDSVTFDDSASSFAVELQAEVAPGDVVFNNSANDYTFTANDPASTIVGATGITKNGTGLVDLNVDSLSYTGDTNVNAGTLRLSGGTTGAPAVLTGDFNVASGATLQLSGRIGPSTGNYNIAAGGTLLYSDASQDAGAISAIADSVDVVWNNDGVIDYSFDVAEAQGFVGQITGTGSLVVNSGTAEINNELNDYSGGTTVNAGTLLIDNGAQPGTGDVVVNAGGLVQANGESHTVANNMTFNGGGIRVGGGAASAFTTSGTFTVGTGDASIQLDGGTGDGYSHSGDIVGSMGNNLNVGVADGSTARFSGSISHDGNLTKTGGGVMAFSGATSIPSPLVDAQAGSFDVTGTTSGVLTLGSGQTLKVGGDGFVGTSSLVGHWTFDTDGTDIAPGQGNDATFGSATSIDNSTSIAGGGSVNFSETDAADVDNRVTLPTGGPQGGSARTYSLWVLGDQANADGNATFLSAGQNQPGQRFDIKINGSGGQGVLGTLRTEIQTDFHVFDEATDPAAFASLDNNWHHLAVVVDPSVNPGDGVVTLQDVVFYFDGAPISPGMSANNVEINTLAETIFLAGSKAGGEGRSFEGNIDDVQIYDFALDAGEVSQLFNSPGTSLSLPIFFDSKEFTVTGDLTMDAGSTLALEITGTAVDKLIVDGTFTAGGTLDVSQFGSDVLTLGQTFDILDFTAAGGAFADIMLPALGGGLGWDTTQLLTTGVLEIVSATALAGDFNGDGVVDAADYTVWRDNEGGSESAFPPGTGSGNGTVGPEDYALWRSNFGNTAGSLDGATGAVPEPASCVLIGACLVSGLALRRRFAA